MIQCLVVNEHKDNYFIPILNRISELSSRYIHYDFGDFHDTNKFYDKSYDMFIFFVNFMFSNEGNVMEYLEKYFFSNRLISNHLNLESKYTLVIASISNVSDLLRQSQLGNIKINMKSEKIGIIEVFCYRKIDNETIRNIYTVDFEQDMTKQLNKLLANKFIESAKSQKTV